MGGVKFDQSVLKTQIKLAISRLKLQKQKKDNNIKNQKRELAELLKAGKDESARIKVEGVIRDDFVIEAYDIIELFCELLLARLGVVQISKECPADLSEAVCTLIYAAARTDIKELTAIKELLIAKFGKEFGIHAMSNKDNRVNARVLHKLGIQTPENYLVFQYLNEIAKSYNLEWKAEFEAPIQMPHAENFGHPKVSASLDGNVISNGPPIQFPQIPTNTAVPSYQASYQPAFPPAPFPSFPEPPGHSSSPIPQFHQPQEVAFPDVPVPTFSMTNFPNNGRDTIKFPSNQFVSPGVPTISHHPSTMPEFPSVPTSPSSPNNFNAEVPSFPSVPSNYTATPSTSQFPSPPTSHSTLEFPSPPTTNKDSTVVPDFDELTARFEKLKKRDL